MHTCLMANITTVGHVVFFGPGLVHLGMHGLLGKWAAAVEKRVQCMLHQQRWTKYEQLIRCSPDT